jgi:hypothetical protein
VSRNRSTVSQWPISGWGGTTTLRVMAMNVASQAAAIT